MFDISQAVREIRIPRPAAPALVPGERTLTDFGLPRRKDTAGLKGNCATPAAVSFGVAFSHGVALGGGVNDLLFIVVRPINPENARELAATRQVLLTCRIRRSIHDTPQILSQARDLECVHMWNLRRVERRLHSRHSRLHRGDVFLNAFPRRPYQSIRGWPSSERQC